MNLLAELKKDIHFIEGLNSRLNCGICTAVCPAAQFYEYDPRVIADTLQRGDEAEIERLMKSDTIWYCGECLSCKTRCPRGNTPGYLIQSLRNLAQKNGYFALSERGRQQLEIKRRIGDTILKYGYCVYIDEIETGYHPEQGPVWDWFRQNTDTIMQRIGANYHGAGAGTLRQISHNDLDELRAIFDETGALKRFDDIEKISAHD